MTNHARLLKRALAEKLADYRKSAFVPMTAKQGQQAPGPGGMPVDPMAAGGAPMDPMGAGGMPPAPGGAPMDPMAAGGMPPAPPMDPMAAGGMPPAPPMDPMAAGGMPPADPMAAPLPGDDAAGGAGGAAISKPDVEALKDVQQNTMEIVRQTLEMVGKAKPKEEAAPAAAEPTPASTPGPVTGQPGFDPAAISGPLKLASALSTRLKAVLSK